jgi:hypothetical protein
MRLSTFQPLLRRHHGKFEESYEGVNLNTRGSLIDANANLGKTWANEDKTVTAQTKRLAR